ncbi:cytochrome P450 [Parasphingopyxis algicola]|uniref:cytochrome P450 n=1 Tax=Parasphingopyxis algicola TaxID=2026624 RepID=UPI0015A3D6CF|nr:cytochrome P450 [Parasphingopyxis algicola]QLC26107.1 cytochrome P450 [Parasphingopyxis algicola]
MATAVKSDTEKQETVVVEAPHPWDVSVSDIYVEDRWQPIFKEMREKAPINKVVGSAYGDYWNVTTYKAIQHIESLPDLYSSAKGITIITDPENLPEDLDIRLPMFIAMDRPEHTEQRRVIAPAFTPSEMERMTEEVRGRTAELLDTLPIGERFDWVDTVSIELTTQMLAILFDFPWEDRRKLTEWSDWMGDVENALSEEKRREQLQHIYEAGAYFQRLWDERLEKGEAPDLISRMIHSEMRNMDQFTFMGNLMLLIVGGNDTTRNSMSGYAYGLSQFPEEREKLEQNPELIPAAVQEIIRWQTPLAHMRRTVTEDHVMLGHEVKEGDAIILWYISANRDETMFDRPDDIWLERPKPGRHLAFGYGIHRCVGARLAELQLRLLLEEMAKRRLRVNVIGEPERVSACFVHGYKKMEVELSTY